MRPSINRFALAEKPPWAVRRGNPTRSQDLRGAAFQESQGVQRGNEIGCKDVAGGPADILSGCKTKTIGGGAERMTQPADEFEAIAKRSIAPIALSVTAASDR